jgi:hypothetical protein
MGQSFVQGCQAKFGGVDAPTTFINSTQLSVVTPQGQATGPVTVRVLNPGQPQAGILQNAFQYVAAPPPPPQPQPFITSLNPSSGPLAGGTQVTITGQNFVFGCKVKFGETEVPTTFVTPNQNRTAPEDSEGVEREGE